MYISYFSSGKCEDIRKALHPPTAVTQRSKLSSRNGDTIFCITDWSVGGDSFTPVDL